jgi:hypothetical protein
LRMATFFLEGHLRDGPTALEIAQTATGAATKVASQAGGAAAAGSLRTAADCSFWILAGTSWWLRPQVARRPRSRGICRRSLSWSFPRREANSNSSATTRTFSSCPSPAAWPSESHPTLASECSRRTARPSSSPQSPSTFGVFHSAGVGGRDRRGTDGRLETGGSRSERLTPGALFSPRSDRPRGSRPGGD